MDRRHFVGQIVFGSAVASFVRPISAARAAQGRGLRLKFVGMMGYVTRSDQSLLVALPGAHRMGHYSHVPFLMAPAGSAIAKALGLTAMPGVVAGAFDMTLADAPAGAFVYRCLDGADLEVKSADGTVAVDNRASQLAQMQAIAPGKRLRNNLGRWAQSTVSVEGGLLDNSAAHPDAGKVWSFGAHQQRLTDATIYSSPSALVRLNVGSRVASYLSDSAHPVDLWIVSAAAPRGDVPNPKRLEHGRLLFEYFADAEPITPTCETAEGRITFATEMPCSEASAHVGGATVRVAPPYVDLCPGGGWCCP